MLRSRVALGVAGVSCALASGGCPGGGGALVPASSNPQQNVMVIDEGFDLSVSELRGKVAAAYTEDCVDEPTAGADAAADAGTGDAGADGGVSFDTMKQEVLAQLSAPDDSCHLSVGIGAKTDPLASVAQYRVRWNAMIRANESIDQAFTMTEATAVETAMDAEFQTFAYHGTATSGTVVHENPNVRLVLVERVLASESSLQTSFSCIAQSDIDETVQLLSDPEVYAAFVSQPAQLDSDLAAARGKYDVGVINESFGSVARVTLETLQTNSGCPTPIDMSAYFSILNKIDLAHEATLQGPAALTVQAAGNDRVEIDSGADSLSCDIGDPVSLLVGSYDPNQVRSAFSNSGACVDVYAPGERIVAPYAGDWLLYVDGTSFAAPIVARQVSLTTSTTPAHFDPAQARTDLLLQRLSDGSLPIGLFPKDFFYLPGGAATAALVAAARRSTSYRPVSRVDLHRVLHPLSLVRSLRRR